MELKITENALGLWCVSLPMPPGPHLYHEATWLAVVYREPYGGRMIYRFRFMECDIDKGSQWFEVQIPGSPEILIESTRSYSEQMARKAGNEYHEVLRKPGQSLDEFARQCRQLPVGIGGIIH